MAKINVRNIVLIFGVSAMNIGIGFYDRIINGVGVIRFLSTLPAVSGDAATTFSQIDANVTLNMVNTGTAFNLVALGLFSLVAVFVIGLLAGTLGAGGRA